MNNRVAISLTPGPLASLAAFVIVVAGMKAAADLVVPFLLALFLSILCAQPFFWLRSKRIPTALALLIVIAGVVAAGMATGTIVGGSLDGIHAKREIYENGLRSLAETFRSWLMYLRIEMSDEELLTYVDPTAAVGFVTGTLDTFLALLTNAFLIVLTVVFILLEWSMLEQKLAVVFKDSSSSMDNFHAMVAKVRRYMALKTVVSLFTGVLVTVWLLILGVDYAPLWGLVAFLLNFVPTIGSILAALPAIVVAMFENSLGIAAWTALGYIVVNVVIGNFVEPKILGRDLGLSALIVFLSLTFWGWVLGPVGMLLSVPLTVTAKIVLENTKRTAWIAVLLGSGVEPPAQQSA